MFTGIVEETGKIKNISIQGSSGKVAIAAQKVLENTNIGDSIAVNGVCLTVVEILKDSFVADVMAETVRRSSLGSLQASDCVNLERAMAADGRFGGHIVSGHIDGTGRIVFKKREENAIWIKISTSSDILNYIVEKGSVAIDGISLTVAGVDKESFSVSIIPHTNHQTTLSSKKNGDIVNLETDIVGKYVAKFLGINTVNCDENSPTNKFGTQKQESCSLTMEMLANLGY